MRPVTTLRAVIIVWSLPLTAHIPGSICTYATAGVPPVVRAEGLSELVADIVINCTGDMPTELGNNVPGADFSLVLNTNITNRLTGIGGVTDAVLAIDDPSSANQVLQEFDRAVQLSGVGGNGIDFNNPSASANQGQRVPNVFQGSATGRNSIVWLGIPFDAPGTQSTRIFRIKNVRADASLFRADQPLPAQIVAFVSINAASRSPALNVGTVQPGLLYHNPDGSFATGITGVTAIPLNQAVNPDLPNPPANPSPSVQLRFVEGFANAFKTRTAALSSDSNPFPPPADQSQFGRNYFAETGYHNPRLGNFGLADHGTRVAVRFRNVPMDTKIFTRPIATGMGTSSSVAARIIGDCLGPAAPAPATNGFYQIMGSGFCAEVYRQNPNMSEAFAFPIYFSRPASMGGASEVRTILADLVIVPTAFYPPSYTNVDPLVPIFATPVHPIQASRSTHIAGRFYQTFGVGDMSNPIAISRDPAFANGEFEADGTNAGQGANMTVFNILMGKNATITPILRSGPSAGRQATAGWLTATASQGSTPLTLAVSANPAGLAPGAYTAGVRIDTPAPNPTANEVPIRLIVPGPGPRFGVNGVLGAADYAAGMVAAGQAIVVFGSDYGPAQLAGLTLGADGRVAATLAETRILFDGQPTPMIYAANGQASAFVPFAVAGRAVTEMRIEYRGVRSPPVFLRVLAAAPGLFTANASGSGQGAILNQDGSINSAANPAGPGEVVVLYGSGAGQTDPPGVDGRLAAAPLPALTQPVRVLIDGQQAEVRYAGPAPGLVEGVLQVNAVVPPNVRGRNVEVLLTIGPFRAQPGVTLAIRP
jgi:uncharacterized protein (TIGR03437 family)